jgi:hypothetical protein
MRRYWAPHKDGTGFYYTKDGFTQLNVRLESVPTENGGTDMQWVSYCGGDPVPGKPCYTRQAAQDAAEAYWAEHEALSDYDI